MKLYPAIDLMNGNCVRLTGGNFDEMITYSNDPLEIAKSFETAGAEYLHIVDLDGAKAGRPAHSRLMARIVRETNLKVQIGGGIRSSEGVTTLCDAGVDRIIIGSLAIREPALFCQLVSQYGADKFVLALDFSRAENGKDLVMTNGWLQVSTTSLEQGIANGLELGLRRFLCTDISKDGKLTGPSTEVYTRLQKIAPDIEILASGGVSSLDDLIKLRDNGVYGAVVGKAFYENRFTVEQAVETVRK